MDGHRYIASPNLSDTLLDRERSRRWLAKKIGISSTLMTYVISGERTIGAEKATLAAAVLGKPVDFLFVSTDMINSDIDMEVAVA